MLLESEVCAVVVKFFSAVDMATAKTRCTDPIIGSRKFLDFYLYPAKSVTRRMEFAGSSNRPLSIRAMLATFHSPFSSSNNFRSKSIFLRW